MADSTYPNALSLRIPGLPYQKYFGFVDSLDELVQKTVGIITIVPQVTLVGYSLFLDYESQLAYSACAKPEHQALLRRSIRFIDPIEVIDHFEYESREEEVVKELYRLARARKRMIEELHQRAAVIFE